MQQIIYTSKQHHDFYKEKIDQLEADDYLKALIYTVGISEKSRSRWDNFYDEKQQCIKANIINEGWQTDETMRITRLAFQLFTDSQPTATTYDEQHRAIENFKECSRYSVSDIFCSEYAIYFVEAIKLRYPRYLTNLKSYTE